MPPEKINSAFAELIFENFQSEKTVISFKRPYNNRLDKWLENRIFLCNFCFTQIIVVPHSIYGNNLKFYKNFCKTRELVYELAYSSVYSEVLHSDKNGTWNFEDDQKELFRPNPSHVPY
ncbi:hypothetical protein PIROE2DRAFT_5322 [Piromyces sp. E2]|nr:hypothetical protein PIROE2DRAFT_5322 [Piromyces sp. E2]|eukprot:OUM67264.1 hypothetical protein PIROE2DRAFT_5322 [Piromyces sp. E2]